MHQFQPAYKVSNGSQDAAEKVISTLEDAIRRIAWTVILNDKHLRLEVTKTVAHHSLLHTMIKDFHRFLNEKQQVAAEKTQFHEREASGNLEDFDGRPLEVIEKDETRINHVLERLLLSLILQIEKNPKIRCGFESQSVGGKSGSFAWSLERIRDYLKTSLFLPGKDQTTYDKRVGYLVAHVDRLTSKTRSLEVS